MKALTFFSRRNDAPWAAVALSLLVFGPLSPPLARPAAAQASTPSAATLMAQGAAQEAAGQWETAAKTYGAAAKAYADAGQTAQEADADKKSALMYEKYANALLAGQTPAAPADAAPTEAPPPPAAPETAAPETPAAPAGAAPLPLARSAIVHTNKYGGLAVTTATGAPYDGVKISTHDTNIQSPSLVVTPDGVIHAAFWEQHATGTANDIYYRSSADGGHSWTPAKNLSESMPDFLVGRCQIAADGQGRVYVVWNVGEAEGFPTDIGPHSSSTINNLVYRVLSGGAWNGKPIPIHPMATQTTQGLGSASYCVATDPKGVVHVFWNEDPAILHPEVQYAPGLEGGGVGTGLVMEATLDGSSPSAPRQAYMTPITRTNAANCDGVDMLNGYVDAAGAPHLLARIAPPAAGGNPFHIIENGGQTPGVDLPGDSLTYSACPPTLLRDAQGRQHIITLYQSGEHPTVRDYAVGSDAEPKIIRAVKGDQGQLQGFEAFQGPGGRMVALMDMNDTGKKTDSELYVSESDGGAWSAPVNVTNNTGRFAFHAAQIGLRSNTLTESWGFPSACAATFDKSGHLLLLYVRNTAQTFEVNAAGVALAGNDSTTPNLLFLRF